MTEFTSFIIFLAAVTGLIMLFGWMYRVDARLKALEDKAAEPQEKKT
jgi:hypothetical protein